jgi:uncharacterized protein (DUF1800 family)
MQTRKAPHKLSNLPAKIPPALTKHLSQAASLSNQTRAISANQRNVARPQAGAPADAPLSVLALNRMAFGPRPGDLAAFDALPGATPQARLQSYVEQQLNPQTIDDSAFTTRLVSANFVTLNKSLEQLYADHIVNNPFDMNDPQYWEWYVLPVNELVEATFLRAVFSQRQLGEVLADFWHNHFNVYGYNESVAPVFVSYDRDVIRAHQLGNFRAMLEAVASHPSMLYYLDNYTSSDGGPNENYARELLELHTLGAENYLGVLDPHTVPGFSQGEPEGYVDNDVYEAARCFTGWRVDDDIYEYEPGVGKTGAFLYYSSWHDRFNKLFMGRYLPHDQPAMKDGRDVLDILAAHPGAARYVCRKLCRRLVSDTPPETLVQNAAQVFIAQRDAPDQLKQVVRSILLSPEFAASWGQKAKRPFEIAASLLRATGSEFTRLPDGLRWTYWMMGQPLFERQAPDGYPDRQESWANSMVFLYSWNLSLGVVDNWLNDDPPAPQLITAILAQTPANLNTANTLIDYWIGRALGRAMNAADRQRLVDFLRQEYGADETLDPDHKAFWLPRSVELILMSPDFRWR